MTEPSDRETTTTYNAAFVPQEFAVTPFSGHRPNL
jgi:hypothetical protein